MNDHAPKTIEITVGAEGGTTVETKGFAGGGCRDASRFLEAALGDAVAERLTPEFHRSASTHQRQTRRA